MKQKKIKILDMLKERGFAENEARGLIMSGKIIVNGRKETREGSFVKDDDEVEILGNKKYVSRSAEKLSGALDDFSIDVKGKICMDLGSSTGGFVQVLLERGAERVYAVDVGYGILDFSLRREEKVIVRERCNVRNLKASWLEEGDLEIIRQHGKFFVTCDISFMSLRTVLLSLSGFLKLESLSCEGIFLLKPQFEDSQSTEKGILADETLRDKIVEDVSVYAESLGFELKGVRPAKIRGAMGNQEFVIRLHYGG